MGLVDHGGMVGHGSIADPGGSSQQQTTLQDPKNIQNKKFQCIIHYSQCQHPHPFPLLSEQFTSKTPSSHSIVTSISSVMNASDPEKSLTALRKIWDKI